MKIAAFIGWAILVFYSTMCIVVPEIRPSWQGSRFWTGERKRLGLVSCIGMAVIFWSPALIVTRFIPEGYGFILYLFMIFVLIALCGTGFFIDMNSESRRGGIR